MLTSRCSEIMKMQYAQEFARIFAQIIIFNLHVCNVVDSNVNSTNVQGTFVVIFIRKNFKEDFLCLVGVCEVVLDRHCSHFITTEVYLVLCSLLSRSLASHIRLHSLSLVHSAIPARRNNNITMVYVYCYCICTNVHTYVDIL